MKHFLTQLGAALILLFALNVNAQTLVGLPQYGITLSGTTDNPKVENHSARTLIGTVLVFKDATGHGIAYANLKTRNVHLQLGTNIPVGGSAAPMARMGNFVANGGVGHPTSVVLDLVAFADGGVAGPDTTFTFNVWRDRINNEQMLANFVLHQGDTPATWTELNRIRHSKQFADKDKLVLAADMLVCHGHNRNQDAFDMAGRVLAMPTLWRQK